MEDSGKAPESDCSGDITEELRAFLAVSDDEDGCEFWPDIKEELVEEVMQELWKEINSCQSDTNPSSSPEALPGLSSSLFVAGGDKESCGPSFSGSSSAVMAGIDVGGGGSSGGGGLSCFVGPILQFAGGDMGFPVVAGNGSWVVEERGGCYAEGGTVLGEKMEGRDGKEADDEWLTRVLSWGPQELDEWI